MADEIPCSKRLKPSEEQTKPSSREEQTKQTKPSSREEQSNSEEQSSSVELTKPSSSVELTKPSSSVEPQIKPNYYVKYENNGSKRWDGKTVMIGGEWLHGVCNQSEIHCGDKVKLPWTAKKGKVQYWNAVVVDDAGMEGGSCKKPKSKVSADDTKKATSLPKSKAPRKIKGMGHFAKMYIL